LAARLQLVAYGGLSPSSCCSSGDAASQEPTGKQTQKRSLLSQLSLVFWSQEEEGDSPAPLLVKQSAAFPFLAVVDVDVASHEGSGAAALLRLLFPRPAGRWPGQGQRLVQAAAAPAGREAPSSGQQDGRRRKRRRQEQRRRQ
jgi:hypothetical protein